jgi:hypothetical protein
MTKASNAPSGTAMITIAVAITTELRKACQKSGSAKMNSYAPDADRLARIEKRSGQEALIKNQRQRCEHGRRRDQNRQSARS